MDTATLLVIALLMLAASLASYYLSQRNAIRSGALAWAGLSLGALLLIVAAAITLLAIAFLSTLQFAGEQRLEMSQTGPSRSGAFGLTTNPFTQSVSKRTNEEDARASDTRPDRRRRTTLPPEQAPPSHLAPMHPTEDAGRSRQDSRDASGTLANTVNLAAAPNLDPWSATHCVVLLRRDPAQETRWTIENDCGESVGIVIASCEHAEMGCSAAGSTLWKYRTEVVLPDKAARTIIEAEQIVHGRHVRDAACVITESRAVELLTVGVQQRTEEWRGEFETARQRDDCLVRLHALAQQGLRTGRSPGTLLGSLERISAR